MSQTELKLRVVFASCAILALCAALAQFAAQGGAARWPLVAAMGASLLISIAEASGRFRLAQDAHWRLVASALLGIAALYTLEC